MFKQKHKNSIIAQVLRAAAERNRQLTIETFREMGEYFLSITHEVRGYKNQTHNLSSSKGYAVFDNGNRVAEGGI
jgi:hypothetical protein